MAANIRALAGCKLFGGIISLALIMFIVQFQCPSREFGALAGYVEPPILQSDALSYEFELNQ